MAGADPARVAALRASLRDLYADEIRHRLPLLRSALDDLAPDSLAVVRTQAHTFASSAVVVGELATAKAAADCERLLTDPAAVDLAAVREAGGVLADLLAAWCEVPA
jgi:hypothetical protein